VRSHLSTLARTQALAEVIKRLRKQAAASQQAREQQEQQLRGGS
jgi:hypothetical protein